MSVVVVKGELCSCSCNFVSVMIGSKGENDKFRGNQGKKVLKILVRSCTFVLVLLAWLGHGRKSKNSAE